MQQEIRSGVLLRKNSNFGQFTKALEIVNSSSKQWRLRNFLKNRWDAFFPLIEEADITFLSLYNNDMVIDCRLLSIPRLHSLQSLYLSYNRIRSLEGLVKMQCANLVDLNLMSNQITTVKPLRKMYLPKLEEINISNNPIGDPHLLSQLTTKSLKEMHIERWENNPLIGESLAWVFCIQAANPQAVTFKSKKRILQAQPREMIPKRFIKCK